jgi:hypothetical protein
MHHQEIVTPKWLVQELFEYINTDAKTVLDPCVGPGVFVDELFDLTSPDKITVMDIQEIHIKNFD